MSTRLAYFPGPSVALLSLVGWLPLLVALVRPLYLAYISPISRLFLAYFSPISRLFLAYISPISRLYLAYISLVGWLPLLVALLQLSRTLTRPRPIPTSYLSTLLPLLVALVS